MEYYPHLSRAIARVLSRRRAELSMSKKKLSEEAMIARVHITHLEEGIKSPSMNAVFYLCDALGLNPSEFMADVQAEMEKLKTEEAKSPVLRRG